MRSFREVLPEVTTTEELREVMRELVHRGSRNWTYHSAAQYLAPELWEELTKYFDDVTGRPRWPDGGSNAAKAIVWGIHINCFSKLVDAFHKRLHAVIDTPRDDFETAEGIARPSSANREGEWSEGPGAGAASAFEPAPSVPSNLLPDEKHFCTICEGLVAELAQFRGQKMCPSCAALLRGY